MIKLVLSGAASSAGGASSAGASAGAAAGAADCPQAASARIISNARVSASAFFMLFVLLGFDAVVYYHISALKKSIIFAPFAFFCFVQAKIGLNRVVHTPLPKKLCV
jgi:hypothetical protein